MRNSFRGYYPPTEAEYRRLWSEGIIVLDTNVLLDLYRLPSSARDELLSVLDLLRNRLWIPHQVALEFQRRRLTVIAGERKATESALSSASSLIETLKRRVDELQIDKRGLGLSAGPLVSGLQAANEKLLKAIQTVHDAQPDIASSDPIRDRLDEILGDHVGPPPTDQAELDVLIADGDHRFANKIPPGYADADKDKNISEASFVNEHLLYQRKFGDLILWRQLLNHVKNNNIRTVLFVTRDRKEDWWWREEGKTIGAHPELVQEIARTANVELFWMYTSVQFVEQSANYTTAGVSPQSVNEIREVVRAQQDLLTTGSQLSLEGTAEHPESDALSLFSPRDFPPMERAVEKWLEQRYGDVERNERGFPDLLVQRNGSVHGFEIKFMRNFDKMLFSPGVVNALLRGYLEVNEGRLSSLTVVALVSEREAAALRHFERHDELERRIAHLMERYPIAGLLIGSVVQGVLEVIAYQGGIPLPE